jgi:DNA-binding NtrC family response regulator
MSEPVIPKLPSENYLGDRLTDLRISRMVNAIRDRSREQGEHIERCRWTSMADPKSIGKNLVGSKRLFSQARQHRRTIDKSGIVVGESPSLYGVFEAIHHVNCDESEPSVVLLGATGVGKTILAKLIHGSSRRAGRPYKEVNAAGSGGDANIQRGEWIGYGPQHGIVGIDKGGKSGHFGEVEGGSLFVDEFSLLSGELQGIFLSVLEKRSIEQVGGRSITPDVRCIFASNANLGKEMAIGKIRKDLLARIAVAIVVPRLADRRGDILALARHFAGRCYSFSPRSSLALLSYRWPENVRELQNSIRGAVSRKKLEGGSVIDVKDLALPLFIDRSVNSIPEDACPCKLWTLVDEIAQEEGFQHGSGRQRRSAEIMGVKCAQASKAYSKFGLSRSTVSDK